MRRSTRPVRRLGGGDMQRGSGDICGVTSGDSRDICGVMSGDITDRLGRAGIAAAVVFRQNVTQQLLGNWMDVGAPMRSY
jgi:hypothetical protein